MNITCQSCGQALPKTVLVCPSCGSRQLRGGNLAQNNLSQTNQTVQSAQTTQYHVPFESQLAPNQALGQNHLQNSGQNFSQPTPQTQPQPQATVTVPTSMPVPVFGQPPTPQYEQNYTQNPAPNPVSSYTQSYPQPASQNYAPPTVTPSYLPPVTTTPLRQANTMQYAGFVRRGFAFVFDVAFVGMMTALAWQYAVFNFKIPYVPNSQLPIVQVGSGMVLYLLIMAFLSSRARQGSIGKRMLGLWVFDMQGQRIGFFHAFFREVVKLALLPFAFVMWFTARKQTLHDLLGRTVVLLDR